MCNLSQGIEEKGIAMATDKDIEEVKADTPNEIYPIRRHTRNI